MALLRSSTACESPSQLAMAQSCRQSHPVHSSSLSYGRFPHRRAFESLYWHLQPCIKLGGRTGKVRACADAQETSTIKFETHGSAVLEDIPHLTDWLPDLPTYDSPLYHNPAYATGRDFFVGPYDVVARKVVVSLHNPGNRVYFRRAGPSEKVYFKAEEVHACIVTCGGLCPGLNTVIREIVCGLWNQYGVQDIVGIEGGYRGFYARNTIPLNPKNVNDIHKRGGTVLGTSRGGHDTSKIVNSIEDRGINQVYIIGGDGTQKGAAAIYKEVRRRGLKVNVTGIPKTIDNDIAVIDRSFGFDTAVEEAQRAINAAHTEAESCENGIGLVKLMGRYSGYIAMYATLASRDVDLCLIPEVPFYLEGEGGLYDFVDERLRENGHMVIVVAEGAGQELVHSSESVKARDASGNQLLLDVGLWLSRKLKDHYSNKKEVLNLKYIDPTYMIRAIPSNAADNVYSTLLAQFGIHGAMGGYTGFTVGPVNGRHCYIPISRVTETQNRVNIADRMWARLLSSTNQPPFINAHQKIIEELERASECSATISPPKETSSKLTTEHEGLNRIPLLPEPLQKTEIDFNKSAHTRLELAFSFHKMAGSFARIKESLRKNALQVITFLRTLSDYRPDHFKK